MQMRGICKKVHATYASKMPMANAVSVTNSRTRNNQINKQTGRHQDRQTDRHARQKSIVTGNGD